MLVPEMICFLKDVMVIALVSIFFSQEVLSG
jgi:hypothetical protein